MPNIFGWFKKNAYSKHTDTSYDGNEAVIDGVINDPKTFGIKSYLHNFYQSPVMEDVEHPGTWLLLPPPPAHRKGMMICRFLTVIGIILLIAGSGFIVAGYTWPHEPIEESLFRIAIDTDDLGNFYIPPERLAHLVADPMKQWKMIGFCLFSSGAVLMGLGLLIPTLASCIGGTKLAAFASEDGTPNEPPIRIYAANGHHQKSVNPPKKAGSNKISPTSGPVPVAEELSKIQPATRKSLDNSSTIDDLLLSTDENTPFIK
uniref:Ion_trans_2 domain-containing protein n=1 Tax=Rhabditophanes sp. KR3021 TaxID=114890 RepID=A0AC35TUG3_9BILA